MNIIITGCTGVGKTTIAKKLKQELNAILIEEPIIQNNFLVDSYNNPSRYGVLSQITFMLSFAKLQDNWNVSLNNYLIQERCISDCLFIFAKNLLLRGKIEEREFDLLQNLHDYLISKTLNNIDRFIYLSAPVKTIEERLRLRGREFESKIDLDFIYIQSDLYDQWFNNKVNVLKILNNDIDSTINEITEWLKKPITKL